eukprot:GHVT01067793.1.p1 GENE.GHVT01067793.1~~GHVT01067793.1.p1  ORF type:complete len:381 (-),score=26.88 GHVT01067793.1:363-1505(-)
MGNGCDMSVWFSQEASTILGINLKAEPYLVHFVKYISKKALFLYEDEVALRVSVRSTYANIRRDDDKKIQQKSPILPRHPPQAPIERTASLSALTTTPKATSDFAQSGHRQEPVDDATNDKMGTRECFSQDTQDNRKKPMTVADPLMQLVQLEEIIATVQVYRTVFDSFRLQAEKNKNAVRVMRQCINCTKRKGTAYCPVCRDIFCDRCFQDIHRTGRRREHMREPICLDLCAECARGFAVLDCPECQDVFCCHCFGMCHRRGGRKSHVPVVLPSLPSVPNLSRTREPSGKLCAAVLGFADVHGVDAATSETPWRHLSMLSSPWLPLTDSRGLPLYCNIRTGSQSRVIAPEMVNQPLTDLHGQVADWLSVLGNHQNQRLE